MVTNQAYLFLIFIVNGLITGFLFDFFRILRKSFKTKDFVTYIEDIVFWILTGFIVLYSIFVFNNGEIRFFIFLGIALGVLLYMTIFSNSIIKVSVFVIQFIKNIIIKIIHIVSMPFSFIIKIIKKVFHKPVSFITLNIKNIFKNIKNVKIRPKQAKISK
ncbi:MAG: spore cortex biosynthesis protein YabQ [Clostridia bacterium]|nr:spore cortex biosynthesis protein YabQ [Clostridia bacterium]